MYVNADVDELSAWWHLLPADPHMGQSYGTGSRDGDPSDPVQVPRDTRPSLPLCIRPADPDDGGNAVSREWQGQRC